ncbi:hypothetical protein D3C75_556180 [compost metagenome]
MNSTYFYDIDNEKKLLSLYVNQQFVEDENFLEFKNYYKKKKYHVATFISGSGDIKDSIKQLVLQNI